TRNHPPLPTRRSSDLVYEDAGVDCLQIGEPNSKNQALLNALRATPLPVIHKRGNSLDTEAYLLWVERMMTGGKENVILCERGIRSEEHTSELQSPDHL